MTQDERHDREVRELVEAVSKMPPPPPLPELEPLPLDKIRCACGQWKDLSVARFFNTGVINACEAVCRECRNDYKDLARIVCCSCRTIVGYVKPGRDPKGFVFLRDGSYHVEACGFCNPEVTSCTIIEKLLYDRRQRGEKGVITSIREDKTKHTPS